MKQTRKNHSSLTKWITAGTALALALVIFKNFPAVRRYIKMELM